MTATHLKRLFANQDVFNSLDRNVAGLTVSEADEKETKSVEGDSEPSSTTPTPTIEEPPVLAETSSLAPPSTVSSSDGQTPIAGLYSPVKNPLSGPHSPLREYDSDSTISARPRADVAVPLLRVPPADNVESSEMDTDANQFVSKLPRRSRPTPR